MKIVFKESYSNFNLNFDKGDMLEDNALDIKLEKMSKIIILIYKGLRYDIPIDIVKIIEE